MFPACCSDRLAAVAGELPSVSPLESNLEKREKEGRAGSIGFVKKLAAKGGSQGGSFVDNILFATGLSKKRGIVENLAKKKMTGKEKMLTASRKVTETNTLAVQLTA